MNENYSLTEIQQAIQHWLYPYPWNYFITLGFDRNISPATCEKQVKQFLYRYNRRLIPPRAGFRLTLNSLSIIEEHKSGRLHSHVLIGGPITHSFYQAREHARHSWLTGKSEYMRQTKLLRKQGRSPGSMAFFVPNAAPKPSHTGKEEWFKPVYCKAGVLEYLSKDSRKSDSTFFLDAENIKLDVLAT